MILIGKKQRNSLFSSFFNSSNVHSLLHYSVKAHQLEIFIISCTGISAPLLKYEDPNNKITPDIDTLLISMSCYYTGRIIQFIQINKPPSISSFIMKCETFSGGCSNTYYVH